MAEIDVEIYQKKKNNNYKKSRKCRDLNKNKFI